MTEWCNTERTLGRLIDSGRLEVFAGMPHFQGRHIICRDSPVDKGVYLGGGQREAVVVDSEKYPALKALYNKAKQKATLIGVVQKDLILDSVYETVSEAMSGSEADVEDFIFQLNIAKDKKVTLDMFIEQGIGLCRHQALACAAILELFKKDGIIRGRASVDRNYVENWGSHSWCRYTNSLGYIYILDAALKNIGLIDDVSGPPEKGKWPYKRPGECKSTFSRTLH